MKKTVAILLCASLLCVCFALPALAAPVVVEAGSLRVSFPGDPVYSEENAEIGGVTIPQRLWYYANGSDMLGLLQLDMTAALTSVERGKLSRDGALDRTQAIGLLSRTLSWLYENDDPDLLIHEVTVQGLPALMAQDLTAGDQDLPLLLMVCEAESIIILGASDTPGGIRHMEDAGFDWYGALTPATMAPVATPIPTVEATPTPAPTPAPGIAVSLGNVQVSFPAEPTSYGAKTGPGAKDSMDSVKLSTYGETYLFEMYDWEAFKQEPGSPAMDDTIGQVLLDRFATQVDIDPTLLDPSMYGFQSVALPSGSTLYVLDYVNNGTICRTLYADGLLYRIVAAYDEAGLAFIGSMEAQ